MYEYASGVSRVNRETILNVALAVRLQSNAGLWYDPRVGVQNATTTAATGTITTTTTTTTRTFDSTTSTTPTTTRQSHEVEATQGQSIFG